MPEGYNSPFLKGNIGSFFAPHFRPRPKHCQPKMDGFSCRGVGYFHVCPRWQRGQRYPAAGTGLLQQRCCRRGMGGDHLPAHCQQPAALLWPPGGYARAQARVCRRVCHFCGGFSFMRNGSFGSHAGRIPRAAGDRRCHVVCQRSSHPHPHFPRQPAGTGARAAGDDDLPGFHGRTLTRRLAGTILLLAFGILHKPACRGHRLCDQRHFHLG